MAEPIENKRSLIDRLEKDRQRMAVRVCELKREYNVADQLRALVRTHPWIWFTVSASIGFLLSRLPTRTKKVYLWADPLQQRPSFEVRPVPPDKDDARIVDKFWSLAKPIISTYIGRELYRRVK
jgi:hypothetical protein